MVLERVGVQAGKQMARKAGRAQFFHNCPRQYDTILVLIDALKFEDDPKYEDLYHNLEEVRILIRIFDDQLYKMIYS